MSKRTVVWGSVVGVASVAMIVALVLMPGCQKQRPVAQSQTPPMKEMSMQDHAAMNQASMKPAVSETVATEQTTCPVMGNPINKNIFVEYQGKKVYFCCNGCPAAFQADPQKYLAKLPQFAK